MTVTSWSLELITGLITLINAFIFAHDASLEISIQILIAIHTFLYFVVIPGSYLLSTEVYKNLIFDKGWYIVLPYRKNKNKVAPEPINEIPLNGINEASPEMEEDQPNSDSTAKNKSNKTVTPIPIISGNVNLETSYVVY